MCLTDLILTYFGYLGLTSNLEKYYMKKYYHSTGLTSLILLMLPAIGYTAIVEISKDGLTTSIVKEEGVDSKPSNALVNPTVSLPGTFATIKVDGDLSEWVNIPILISDPVGDYLLGADIVNVKIANDKDFVYFLEEFSSPRTNYTYIELDTDLNRDTGCAGLLGAEYGITFGFSFDYIGDARDCGWTSNDFPGALVRVESGRFLEASVPISILEILSPGLTAFNIFTGNDGSAARYNFAAGGSCLGLTCTINGNLSEKVIQGTNGDDVICGTDKDDIILGKDGNDTICGGAGNDVILAGNGHDRVEGGPGNDVIDGGNGMDMLDGGEGNDVLLGGNDGDLLYGGMGFDYLGGGLGQDMLNGGPDDDICEKENSDKLLVSCENKVSSTNMSVLTLDKNFVSPELAKNLNILVDSARF